MKFTVKENFASQRRKFEPGNRHDSEVLHIPEAQILRWRQAGWVDVEGMDPGPKAQPGVVKVQPDDREIGNGSTKGGVS